VGIHWSSPDRRYASVALYPAIDVKRVLDAHEELLFPRDVLPQVWKTPSGINGLAAEGRDAAASNC